VARGQALSILLVALSCAALAQGDVDRLLGEERYREALEATESLTGVERARGRTLTLWSAGDLGGALKEARAGLEEHDDLMLRYYGAQLAIELRDTDMAWREYVALDAQLEGLDADDPWRPFLQEQLPLLLEDCSTVVTHSSSRIIARTLATWIVGFAGLLTILMSGWCLAPSRRSAS
jgi:hypothetical protein